MSYSLNEIEALSKRAARGAGLSWGMAEEAAKTARWLASHNLPGVALLANVLTLNDKTPHIEIYPKSLQGLWEAPSGTLCPLASGAALNDCADRLAQDQTIRMANVSHPLLVVPFAAWVALHIQTPVTVSWLDIQIDTDGFGLWLDGSQNQITAKAPVSLICTRAERRDDEATAPSQRGTVDLVAWAHLNAFALRTYAPATEESRRLGAGAGVSDND